MAGKSAGGDAAGRQRSRRFASEEAARTLDEARAEVSPTPRRSDTARHVRSGGVYSYRTADGVPIPPGTQTTKRGFVSERAARDARRRLVEQVERGEVRPTKETFGGFWQRWLERRRPYLEAGTWTGYEIDGRKRLLPAFGSRLLGDLRCCILCGGRTCTAISSDGAAPLGWGRRRR